jgi:hypothetical protein
MKRIFALILLVSLGTACSTGKRAFEKGNYEKAVLQAVERLRDDTDNEDATKVLPAAYRLSIQTRENGIRNLKTSLDPFRNEAVAREYALLNNLADEIQRCPACLRLVKPKRYDNELEKAQLSASSYRISLAKAKLQNKENRESAKDAYRDLQVAKRLTPNNQEITALLDEALYYGTLHVVVQPLANRNDFNFNYMDVLNQRFVEYLHNTNINPFVRFYTPGEADNANIEWVDHEITMGISFFMPAQNTHTETYTLSKDSVRLDGPNSRKVRYGTVKATVVERSIELASKADLAIFISSNNGKTTLRNEVLTNGYVWRDVSATFNGDERALDDEALSLINHKPLPLPGPDFLFKATTDPLYGQAVDYLRNYYRRY